MSLAPPQQSLMPGYRLDRYELLALVAEGGMGQVWLARLVGKHGFEKLVAVKTLLPKFAADLKFQQMFLDEARIASGIEHANVAQILDLGEQNDVLYLVMEFVDGEALSKLSRVLTKTNVEFPLAVGLRIISDTCAGIHVAHELRTPDGRELGIVHRDISPQNVLLTTTGAAKLIDFGIAKARDRFAGETGEGLLKGKIHYMAPEQALGRKVDRRADVFALGAILYQLFAGRPAYDGESQLATLHMLTSGRPPLPLPPRVPRPVGDVIRKALASAPEDRFATAQEMQRAINRAMTECGLSADTTDVAAFAVPHLAERTQRRRSAVDLALKAAAARTAANVALLCPTSSKSSPGTGIPFGAITPAAGSLPEGMVPPSQPDPARPRGPHSVPETDGAMLTPGGELVETAISASARRRRRTPVVLAGLAALVLTIGIAVVATRGPSVSVSAATTGTAAALPLPSGTTAPPPSKTPSEQTLTVDASEAPAASGSAQPQATTAQAGSPRVPPVASTTKPTNSATAPHPKPTSAPDFGY